MAAEPATPVVRPTAAMPPPTISSTDSLSGSTEPSRQNTVAPPATATPLTASFDSAARPGPLPVEAAASTAPDTPISSRNASPAGLSHQEIMRVIGGIVLCILLAALDQTVVIPAVPAIAQDLNGFGHLSWIVTSYLITSTVATPLYGKLSDTYGRKLLLMVAIGLFVLASVACALAGSLERLIMLRALQGIGGGGLLAVAQASIADVVAPRERGRYQGYLATVWAAASITGPLLGGWVADHMSWRWLFWVNVPLGVLAMLMCHRGLSRLPVRGGRPRVDVLGAVLLTVAIVTLLFAMSWGGDAFPWLSLPMAGLCALTVLAVGALAWQERRAADPLLPPRLFANRPYVLGVAASSMAALNMFLCIFALPLQFQLVRGVDAASSGMLVVPFLLSTVAGNFVVAALAPRLGKMRGILTGAYAATTAGLFVLAWTGADTPIMVVLAAMVVAGMGLGASMVGTLTSVQNVLDRQDIGAGTGAMLVVRSLGSAFGGALAGTLLTGHFRQALAEAGVTQALDLGALRHGSEAFAQLPANVQLLLVGGVESGFHMIFGAGVVAGLIAIYIVRRTPDLELRSGVAEHATKLSME
jgi:EmrB/QacA subfamily drug resistance transporter